MIARTFCVLLAIAAVILDIPQAEALTPVTITADFGSRANTTHPIPADIFGVGLGGALRSDMLPLMREAGLTFTRFHANVQTTFATSTPDWSALDTELGAVRSQGLHVILEMDFTPASLQPAVSPCASGVSADHASPTSSAAFAAMAVSYVKHIDGKFPGIVTDYEVWNEPDAGGLCVPGNTPAEKLSKYLEIYAATTKAIHDAAAKDGALVRTGGPALGGPVSYADAWLSALLSNSSTAPYVDFVSFHYYVSGSNDVAKGMTWEGGGSVPSLYALTQSSGNTGIANVYKAVAALVRRGSQPNAGATPIYLDEYNSDYSFVTDCCRNSETYAPVWNAMVYVDLLNTVYSGAFEVPSKMLYYAVSNHPFCLAGVYDAEMDCLPPASGSPVPYPQYYAMKLFSSTSYLGLQNGGHMAVSIASSNTVLLATAFWTAGGDTIVVVNPTGTPYADVSIVANHTGTTAAQGTKDLLNSTNRAITTEPASLHSTPLGCTTSINIPAYSVVAVTLAK